MAMGGDIIPVRFELASFLIEKNRFEEAVMILQTAEDDQMRFMIADLPMVLLNEYRVSKKHAAFILGGLLKFC